MTTTAITFERVVAVLSKREGRLEEPRGVAVLPFSASTLAELLVVADYGNDRLLLVQASPRDGSGGELLLSLLGPPQALRAPTSVVAVGICKGFGLVAASSGFGSVSVCAVWDVRGNLPSATMPTAAVVQVLPVTAPATRSAGAAVSRLGSLCVDKQGCLFVPATGATPCVYRMPARWWESVFHAGGSGQRESGVVVVDVSCEELGKDVLKSPVGCAVDDHLARLYVVEKPLSVNASSSGVLVLDKVTGSHQFSFGSERLHRPYGICLDAESRVLVADQKEKCVLVFAPDGSLLCQVGDALGMPTGIATNNRSQLFAADIGGDRVFLFDRPGWSTQAHATLPASLRSQIKSVLMIARSRGMRALDHAEAGLWDLPDEILFHIFCLFVDSFR